MNFQKVATTVLLTALGVFIAGLAMNAGRRVAFIRQAIDGFDS